MTAPYPYALTFDQYRERLARDHSRMVELAPSSLDAEVPACPGWTVEDLLRHTAMVYLHKAESIRTGAKPTGTWPPAELALLQPVHALQQCYGRLTEQFDAHAPEDPAFTWVKDDQSVGFWIRRLAHETSIHRYDLESALDSATPIDPDLATDGIDEILTVMLVRSKPDDDATGATVTLRSAGLAWTLAITRDVVTLERQVSDRADAQISGRPSELLLWLWGRGPLPEGARPSAPAEELRRRLASAT
ncbi:maleylpyruvate isomerase family mycothiol-dependent enzyme [Arthrobacter sp. CAN_A1]|uniref:maleylpyruvate isomerase family mycothiol-dependent enzyme n=1 Tax=Arthrobacter sp. CAN_A1 TaxID=2787717 RepID=UPI0018CA8111